MYSQYGAPKDIKAVEITPSKTTNQLTYLPTQPFVINLRDGYQPIDLKADNPVRVVIIPIFWTALLLNSISQTNRLYIEEPVLSHTLEALASILYAVNLLFLILGKVPGRGPLAGPGCDCRCTCMSRPYAIASTVFFAFSIGSFIFDFVYLG